MTTKELIESLQGNCHIIDFEKELAAKKLAQEFCEMDYEQQEIFFKNIEGKMK